MIASHEAVKLPGGGAASAACASVTRSCASAVIMPWSVPPGVVSMSRPGSGAGPARILGVVASSVASRLVSVWNTWYQAALPDVTAQFWICCHGESPSTGGTGGGGGAGGGGGGGRGRAPRGEGPTGGVL